MFKMIKPLIGATIGLPVNNIEKAVDWYRLLIASGEEVSPVEGIWEIQLTDDLWLQLFESDNLQKSPTSLNFETADIEQSHELVSTLHVEVGNIETVPEAVKYFEFSDPFGNNLSFYQTL